jgi:Leucine-rich repeat (LRR) protein
MRTDIEELKLMSFFSEKTQSLRLDELKSLRALSFVNPSVINCQVMNAKHLRYLEISSSDIVRLPDSISMLYNLQTLRLNGCLKLQLLPDGISAMKMLIHLYLLGCDHLERMPLNIGLLNKLCTLTTFVVDTESGRGIEELKDLCHIGNRLELFNLRKIKSGEYAKKANLHQKHKLSELLLCWGHKKEHEPEDEVSNEEEVLVSLAPHSKLKILEVYGYGGLEISQWMRDPEMFRCLRKLTVSNCPRCKDLPTVWLSDSLEYLCAKNMGNLTTLCKSIGVEAEGYNTPLQFFPKLKTMVLHRLPNLERWTPNCAGECSSLSMFPLLEHLEIIKCPKLTSVPSCPVLKYMRCCSLPISSLAHLTTLVYFAYDGTGFSSASMPFQSWEFLVNLELRSQLASMTMPLENQQSQSQRSPLETLRELCLLGPNNFITTSGLSKSHLLLWKCFTFLEKLVIFDCEELVRWPLEELRSLVRLRFLSIADCNNLEGRGLPYEETLPLPQLEKLMIQFCGSLQHIPKLPSSLHELDLLFCTSLVALPPGLGDLPKLTTFSVNSCGSLEALPDRMDGLTSLERFSIICCPGIEKFPEGLLQLLPAIKRLCVQNCPDLGRRCREGGEYFYLVSSIPEKSIREIHTVSNKRKFLRRLLPSCVDSN